MRRICTILVILTIAFTGCLDKSQIEESRVMDKPEIFTINLGVKGMFYPSVKMSPFNGFVAVVDASTKSEKNSDSNLYCFDLVNGKIAWEKVIELGYHGRLEYAGQDGNVFAKLDGKLTCLDLVTGKTIWQSKESIDWVEKAMSGFVYCASNEENRRNDDTYRNLLCFDAKSGENVWSVEVSTNFWNGYYGDDEIAYFDWLEDGRNLLIRDAKTGVLKQKIQGADMIGENYDNKTNVLYRLWNNLFIHTPEKELSIYKFGRIDKKMPAAAVVSQGKLLLQVKNNETQIIDLGTGKTVSTVPENIMQARIISGKACFVSDGKFNAYDPETGKLLWFFGQVENFNDDVILVPADNKTLRLHSMGDGSFISEIKLEDEIYKSVPVDGFGFIVSTKNGKIVILKTVNND